MNRKTYEINRESDGFNVLCIDDEAEMLRAYERMLRNEVDTLRVAETPEHAVDLVREADIHLVLMDLRIPGYDVLDTIPDLVAAKPDLPVIVVTGHGTITHAVRALRAGASDFLEKPVTKLQLIARIEPIRKIHHLRRQAAALKRRSDPTFRFPGFVGSSRAIDEIKATIVQVARTDVSVMILGETGTGKEVAARSIHAHSDRADEPFVVVDCASMPASMIESELFGHRKGAFTGALDANPGLIRAAEGGTLFLDEVGELPLELQTRFLRVLQEREVRPIGTTQPMEVNVRVLSATNRDLRKAIRTGEFRADLYYRLNTVAITMPPLRDHPEDIPELAEYFLAQNQPPRLPAPTLTGDAVARLQSYDWPGNARELQNLMRRTMALSTRPEIDSASLVFDHERTTAPDDAWDSDTPHAVPDDEIGLTTGGTETLAEHEMRFIRRRIQALGGNKKAAAIELGIAESTLHRKLRRQDQQE